MLCSAGVPPRREATASSLHLKALLRQRRRSFSRLSSRFASVDEPLWQSDMSKDYEQSGDRRNKRNASESLQKNGRYRKGVEREHFAIAVKQMESSHMSRSVSRIRAAYRSLRDHRTRIRAGRNLAAMEDAFLWDIGISRAEIHYSVARRSSHCRQGAALLSA